MRRALGSLLLSLSLVLATVSWSGFIMTRTVFDPGRSERLADELLENEDVRAVIIERLAETINQTIPPDIAIDDAQLETAAETVLDDAAVQELVKEKLVVAHQNALDGVDEPVQVDATVIGQAGRDAAVAQQPALDGVLPEVPPVEISVPTSGFAWLGTVNSYVRTVSLFTGIAAVAGILISLFITSDRPRVLRRVAYWAFGAAAFWIVAAIVAPWVISLISPSSMVLASAAINVFFGAMIPPAIGMAIFGAVLFGISSFLPRYNKQKTAGQVQASRQRPQQHRPQQRARPQQQATRHRTPKPASGDVRYQQGYQPEARPANFDNQRLQRQVDASRAANSREFVDNNTVEDYSGPNQHQESSPQEEDWFESPTGHHSPAIRESDPWDDNPPVSQQRPN